MVKLEARASSHLHSNEQDKRAVSLNTVCLAKIFLIFVSFFLFPNRVEGSKVFLFVLVWLLVWGLFWFGFDFFFLLP